MWGGREKSGWGVSWTTSELSASTPISGLLQPRTRGNGAERQNMGRNISEKNKAGLRHAVVCPDVTGRTKERIAQSKRARAGSLALVDSPQVARTCALRAFWFADVMTSFSGVTFALFRFALLCFGFGLYAFVEAAALRSIVLGYAGAPIATHTCVFFLEMSLFPSILCSIAAFCLYGEYVVRSFLPNGVFLPCDHGLDFLHQLV